jgi:DNA-directed RNA polymerase specialized sigma24 family protein
MRVLRERNVPLSDSDEDDVLVSAFGSFWRCAQRGYYANHKDVDDLWKLILTITVRKARQRARDYFALKRGGGRVGHLGAMAECTLDSKLPLDIEWHCEEEVHRLLDLLSPQARRTTLLRLEGYTNLEIAVIDGCSLPTVTRRLTLTRGIMIAEGLGL